MDDKVNVISTVTGTVGITLPELHFKREWPRKGTKLAISKDILREAIYDPGTEYIFKTGMLYIDDMEFKKEIGLEPEDAVEPENVIVLNDKQMKRYLTVAPVRDLREVLPKLSKEQLKNLINYAIEKRVKLIIVTGDLYVPDYLVEMAVKNKVNITTKMIEQIARLAHVSTVTRLTMALYQVTKNISSSGVILSIVLLLAN